MNSIFLRSRLTSSLMVVMCLILGSVPSQVAASEIKVGLVLDKGGKDDKSFNSAAFRGVMKAKEELKIAVKYVEATDDNAFESLIRSLAQKNFDLIIGVGVSQTEAIKKVAGQFPNKKFALVDGQVDATNVSSLLFEEHEGSFLVGAIAAQMSKSGFVGFIGGMDIPIIRRFEKGYVAGAKKINPKIKIQTNYIGMTADAWNNPARAKELAITQFGSGADVIFAAAGASATGLFDAAEEKKKFAIGVDSNQNWVKPGYILTSMVKRVDNAVFMVCKDLTEGKFSGGVHHFGLADKGVDYAIDSFNEKLLPAAVRKKTEELRSEIIAGKIKVPDFYKSKQ